MGGDFVSLSRSVLALCRAGGADGAMSARALSTALAVLIGVAEDPGLLMALVMRDLSESALRGRRATPPPRPRCSIRNVAPMVRRKPREPA